MRILASVIQKIGVGVVSTKTFVSQVVVALSAVAAFTVTAGFGSSVSAVPQGVQSVAGLGTTFVDTTTDGGDWYLVGYGASGNVGRIDSQNGTFNASARTGSATLDASTFVQGATEIAFAWTTAGGSLPTGGLASYDKAISFVLPNASTMTLTGAASPSSGSSASNFSTIGTSADQSTLRVKNIVGTSGMPRYMFIRNKTLGVRSGSSYGLVSNPLINNQLDWTPDTQNFSAIYAGHNGTNGYVTTGGTSNGYVPATMSIWVRKPSECTETSTANGLRRVVKFTRIGTCTWTAPWGVSSVDVLVVAGGGGAGDGGGGAGGVITQTSVSVSNSISVTVGEGGAGSRFHYLPTNDNGSNSKFGSLNAVGGGGGGHWYSNGANKGASGGSGGGSGTDFTDNAFKTTGVAGQGYGGGMSCTYGYGGAAGGGGAGGVGQNGGPTASANNQCTGPNTGQNPTLGGNGGIGVQSSITGSAEWYGGGGGGGTNTNSGPSSTGGFGGQGGGGNGSWCANCIGENGTDGTGGGGGGGDCEGQGGDGGSGIVIISYVQPAATTTTATTTTTTTAPTISTATTTTTVARSATTTVAPALDIVVNAPVTATVAPAPDIVAKAPVTTVAVGQSAISKVNTSSTSSTTPSAQGAAGAGAVTTTTTTPSSNASIAPPAPKISAVAPGEASVMVGDKKETVTVKRADNQVTVTAGKLSATLGTLNKDGGVSALDADGNFRLEPGDTVRIKLAGFKPGSIVEAWLFSTPQLMGTAKVGADGIVVGNFTVPKNVDQGSHRIAVVAKTTDGKSATLTVGVKVGEWKKERSVALWIIILPIVLAVFGALLLPATRRRKKSAA